MSVRKTIPETDGIYFITITNCRWLPLFEQSEGYDAVYHWFDNLKSKGHCILGYVIIPNHLHCLIAFSNTKGKPINTIVGNGKRFMAYDIVGKLEKKGEVELLSNLTQFVNPTDRQKGKLHEVFEPSFDIKPCYSIKFIEQKLSYIHDNPCRGKWNLARSPSDYKHGSANYYLTGKHSVYEVTNFAEMMDIDLTKTGEERRLNL